MASVSSRRQKLEIHTSTPNFYRVLIGFTTARNVRAKVVVLVKKAGNHRNKWRALGRKKGGLTRAQQASKLSTNSQPSFQKLRSLPLPTYRFSQCCLLLLHVPTPPSLCTGLLQGVMNIRNNIKLDPSLSLFFLQLFSQIN